jgi:hypothetical protein
MPRTEPAAGGDDPVSDALRQLAGKLARYPLHTKIVSGAGGSRVLHVFATTTSELTEDVACEPQGNSTRYLWSWGDEIAGRTLADKAAAIAHVLNAAPGHITSVAPGDAESAERRSDCTLDHAADAAATARGLTVAGRRSR